MGTMDAAITPLTDVTTWLRGSALEVVLLVTGAILLARLVRWLGQRTTRRIDAFGGRNGLVRSESSKHRHTLAQVIMWAVIVLIYCVTGAMVLQRLGVSFAGLVVPATVIGVALGFGAQRIVQDLLAGVFIIVERQYGFGDVIRIAALGQESGVSGTVEEVTLRITRLRSANGEVVIVPNGQIVQVTNMSREWARAVVDVPVPSASDVNEIRDTLRRVGRAAVQDDYLGPLLLDAPTVLGVERIELDTLVVRVVARTLPGKQFEVGRELRARVAQALKAEDLSDPEAPGSPGVDVAQPTGIS
ncbi:mechanosensitive ion channel family protein [Rhizomonospora bruguierae]|uniref:mechanosensitive ion channel family protein n=1 Tax=Rhizomonospora bruguierae TaxID=1581705 RepID=UPI001BCF41A6|nr:mechanosensitive ion channel family protein [Micromonospora sp. NBRC 107566]